MLPSFALPFRHYRQAAQPLKPTAGALVEPQWDQPAAMSRRRNLSDCACGASGAGAICPRGAKAAKGLLPGMLPSFALPFRHHRQAPQPLKPTAGALVEPQWDQPAAMSRRRNLSDCACGASGAGAICPRGAKAAKGLLPGMLPSFALPFRHHRQAPQPLKPTAGALLEPQWDQPAAMSRRRNLSDCACGASDAGAIQQLSVILPIRHKDQNFVERQRNFTELSGTLGNNAFTTVAGSNLVTVNLPNINPPITQDSVFFTTGGVFTNGVTIVGTFPVVSLIDANNFVIDISILGTLPSLSGVDAGAAAIYTLDI